MNFLYASSNAILDIQFPRDFELLSDFRRLLSLSRRGNGGKGVGQRKHQATCRGDAAKKLHGCCVLREPCSSLKSPMWWDCGQRKFSGLLVLPLSTCMQWVVFPSPSRNVVCILACHRLPFALDVDGVLR